jgi:hypothetical protein
MAQSNTYTLSPMEQYSLAPRLRQEKRRAERAEFGYNKAADYANIRQAIFSARQAKERVRQKIADTVTAPVIGATDWLLRWSWASLIPSWGLSLIYINMHVFLHWVLGGNFFSALGEEWAPKKARAMAGEAGKTGAKAVGIVESMGLLFLDLIYIFVVIGALALIVMIVTWAEAGLVEKAKWVLGAISNLGWSGVKELVNLFSGLLKPGS